MNDREADWCVAWDAYRAGELTSEQWSTMLNCTPGMRAFIKRRRAEEMDAAKRKGASAWKHAGGWR